MRDVVKRSVRVVKAHEPVSVQTFSTEFVVEWFNEAAVGRLDGLQEVENSALVCPKAEIARDELRALVDADAFGEANAFAGMLWRLRDILTSIVEPRIDH